MKLLKNGLPSVILLSIVIFISISTIVLAYDTRDTDIISDNGDTYLYCFEDKYNPYNPILKIEVETDINFGIGEDSVMGSFYFNDTEGKNYVFSVNIKNGTESTTCTYQDTGTHLFNIIDYVEAGIKTKLSFDFHEYMVNKLGNDVDIYCKDSEFINDPSMLNIMYENYFNDSCKLNDVEITKEEYINYHETHSGSGILYRFGDKIGVKSTSLSCYGLGVEDWTLIIASGIIGGVAASGIAIYKVKKFRQRGVD